MKSNVSKSILLILSTFAVAVFLTQFASKSNLGLNEISSSLRGELLGDQSKPRPTNPDTGLGTITETPTETSSKPSTNTKIPTDTGTSTPVSEPDNSNSSYLYLILFAVFAVLAVGSFIFLRMRKSSDQFDQLKRKWQ